MDQFTIALSTISSFAALISTIVAVVALKNTEKTQKKLEINARMQATVEAFNSLREQALDKFVALDRKNAFKIINGKEDSEDFNKAYCDYKSLIARLEHFSVGVNEGVYDFELVDKLAGEHLIYLYPKIEPIINKANERLSEPKRYQSYVNLVKQLQQKHPEKKESNYGKNS